MHRDTIKRIYILYRTAYVTALATYRLEPISDIGLDMRFGIKYAVIYPLNIYLYTCTRENKFNSIQITKPVNLHYRHVGHLAALESGLTEQAYMKTTSAGKKSRDHEQPISASLVSRDHDQNTPRRLIKINTKHIAIIKQAAAPVAIFDMATCILKYRVLLTARSTVRWLIQYITRFYAARRRQSPVCRQTV